LLKTQSRSSLHPLHFSTPKYPHHAHHASEGQRMELVGVNLFDVRGEEEKI